MTTLPTAGRFRRPARRAVRGATGTLALWLMAAALAPAPVRAEEPAATGVPEGATAPALEQVGDDYLALGLEDLMNLTVTSVSRKSQRVSDAAAAVFVITQEDIRRSGVTSIADALRMVPGLAVARIDSNKWAISSRGFNGRFASKMLVLFDGRSVYTPLFSGVFWDRQDTALEDIDRIEVIRGPGAALWGANAVNGVINIITRSAADTTGGLVSAGAGNFERGFGTVRYGLPVGENGAFRAYGKYLNRAAQEDLSDRDANNRWSALRGGFRYDAEPSAHNSFTLQGDVFHERLHDTYPRLAPSMQDLEHTTPVFGANLISRFKHTFSEDADLVLQFYYDRTDTNIGVIKEKRDTVDLDFQNRIAFSSRQEFLWGGGLRYSHDRLGFPVPSLRFSTESEGTYLASLFLQDDIALVPDRLHFVLGSKLEKNSYTGYELQPNARLIYTPSRHHTLWAAVSRAVRTPSRGEESLSMYREGPAPGVLVHMIGNDRSQAEELLAYEVGYRVEPSSTLSADCALFYNRYRKLNIMQFSQNLETNTPFAPQVAVPLVLGNVGRAETAGFELAADYRALTWWRLRGAYSYLSFLSTEGPAGALVREQRGNSPRHQISLRSSQDLTREVELDLWLRYVSGLGFSDPATGAPISVDGYLTMDCRLAFKPWSGVEIALVGQNLLKEEHQEFLSQEITTQPTLVGRSVYGKVTWQF